MFRHRGYPSQGLTEQTNVSPKRYSTCDTALLSFWHQTIHNSLLETNYLYGNLRKIRPKYARITQQEIRTYELNE